MVAASRTRPHRRIPPARARALVRTAVETGKSPNREPCSPHLRNGINQIPVRFEKVRFSF